MAEGFEGDTPSEALLEPDNDDSSILDDPEIRGSFIAESMELLDDAERVALRIEASAGASGDVDALFRCLHTIKGTAGFLDFPDVSRLAHAAETLISPLRDSSRPWGKDDSERLISAIDEIRGLIDRRHVPREARAHEVEQVQGNSPDYWTRVQTGRLDRMMDAIGELVVLQSMFARETELRGDSTGRMAGLVDSAGKITRELQSLSIGVRLVPVRSAFRKLERAVRDVARKSGKEVQFLTRGEETEVDRNVVDLLIDPLTHMVRNAVDHGLEDIAERRSRGKPDAGRLTLSAEHAGDQIVIELEDDGRGLNRERIRARAIQVGLISQEAAPSERELFQFVFAPGFSTAESVTSVSGRGVGLDVVRKNIEELRGRIETYSIAGQGTRFRVVVPLTLAITDAMLLRAGDERYLLPVLNIEHSFSAEANQVQTIAGRGEVVSVRGELLPVVRLREMLGVQAPNNEDAHEIMVVIAATDRKCALAVDELVGRQRVVSKPVSRALGRPRAIAGAAVLGDGSVGLILDVLEILKGSKATDARSEIGGNR
jgi:two-component system chemotaxis sensor kinase CheA